MTPPKTNPLQPANKPASKSPTGKHTAKPPTGKPKRLPKVTKTYPEGRVATFLHRLKKQCGYLLELPLVLTIWLVFALLGRSLSCRLGALLACAIGPLTRYHSIARHNIQLALPHLYSKSFITECWRNFGRTVAEYPHLGKITPELVECVGLEHIPPQNQPTIYFSAHLANWEAMGTLISQLEARKIVVVERPQNNIWVRKIVHLWRKSGFITTVPKGREMVRRFSSILAKGGAVAALVDQRDRGDEVLFFNHYARVNTIIAALALKHKAVLIPARLERTATNGFIFTLEKPLTISPDDTPLLLTKKMYTHIEKWITQTPSQWLWFHRRWQ